MIWGMCTYSYNTHGPLSQSLELPSKKQSCAKFIMTTQESGRKTGSSKEWITICQVAVYLALKIIVA